MGTNYAAFAAMQPNITINPTTGIFTMPPHTMPGTYNFVYYICSNTGGNCIAVNWSITINPPIYVTDDGNSASLIVYYTNGQMQQPTVGGSYNVLSNDRRVVSCTPATTAPLLRNSVTFTSTTSSSIFSIDNTGNIITNTLTTIPIGTYNLTYTVCDNTFPTICKTATVIVKVIANTTPLTNTTPPVTTNNKVATQTTPPPCTNTGADIINFADDYLRVRLLGDESCYDANNSILVDTNGDGCISVAEAALVYRLQLASGGPIPYLSNLTGLEYFTNLKSINAADNNITVFNLPQPFLGISLWNNPISSFNASLYPNLKWLVLMGTLIQNIDTNACTNLEGLQCGNNPNLTTIKMKNGSSLDYSHPSMQGFCWSNMPALNSICADDFEIPALQNYLATCGVNTAGVAINSDCALGTEQQQTHSFSITPNPSSGIFTITFGKMLDNARQC